MKRVHERRFCALVDALLLKVRRLTPHCPTIRLTSRSLRLPLAAGGRRSAEQQPSADDHCHHESGDSESFTRIRAVLQSNAVAGNREAFTVAQDSDYAVSRHARGLEGYSRARLFDEHIAFGKLARPVRC